MMIVSTYEGMDCFIQALKARLADLSRAFEEATVDKMEQLEKTDMLQKSLDTVSQLRQVFNVDMYISNIIYICGI